MDDTSYCGKGDLSGDGTIDCVRDGTADRTPDTAWDKAEDDDTEVKHNADWLLARMKA